ncbi:HAD hydrolase-like protein [Emticicia sp. ODNR4P]|nr:HAD hydrolase-like protein [Emticicia sp. ODNR4P]
MEQLNEVKQNIDHEISADKVFFFDMDGTLLHTNFSNFLAYRKAIISVTKSDHNLTYNPDERFNRSILKVAVPNLTETEYEKIIKEKEECLPDFLYETKLNIALVNLLIKYSKTNKTVLVTNCRKDRAMTTLKHFGLDDKFSEIICREFDDKGKKINKFQNAILKLGVPPNLVIAFENEEIEIADALKAGILIINPTNQ